MTIAQALEWFRDCLWTTVIAGAPPIAAAVTVGLIMAIIQAATQINDSAVSFAPKALASVTALAIAAPWIMKQLVEFTTAALTAMGSLHQ